MTNVKWMVVFSMWVCLGLGCGDDGAAATAEGSIGDDSSEGSGSGESGSGEGLVCNPAAESGVGIGYAGVAEQGVWCGGELCELGCLFDGGVGCAEEPDPPYGAVVACDGPEDCTGGEVCCQLDAAGQFYASSSCAVACAELEQRLCNDDSDCGEGSCVRAWSNDAKLDVGRCQAEPASACTVTPGADCSGANLAGIDLTWTNLSEIDFCHADLHGARLQRVQLRDAVLAGANLQYADLQDADLGGADLRVADLRGATLSFARLDDELLAGAVLADARFEGLVLDGFDLHGLDLRAASFLDVSLRGADLSGADLRDVVARGVDLTGAELTGAKLDGMVGSAVTCPDGTSFGVLTEGGCTGHLER